MYIFKKRRKEIVDEHAKNGDKPAFRVREWQNGIRQPDKVGIILSRAG
jgi:hypothetical protein